MLGITDIWTYVLGTVAIVLLPGPNSLFVLTTAARRGVRSGYRAAAGVFLGDSVLMFLSAAGLASLLKAYPPLFLAIKYAGAVYLFYVGFQMIRGAWRRHRSPSPGPAGAGQAGAAAEAAVNPFRRAAVISLLNPKSILFFLSFFIQFVDPTYAYPALSFLVLGLTAQLASALYLTLLIFGGTFLAAQFRRRRRLATGAATAAGTLFLGFGLKLATG